MAWWEWIVVVIVCLFYFYVGWHLGAAHGRNRQAAREEAIKLQAYEEGRRSVIGDRIEQMSMMAPELLVHFTRENQHESTQSH